ncbi:MAG: elongation factor P maturation arginine rhamnosyltransferase EarP, partial [Betaproteobacteria bacterium]|nr:elongation factor P maturation arginine rhamnosyltransferase EarP [Betaproteobacteria bacterium]
MHSGLLWDIFCTVIDNHGDLGVCWRLARQLRDAGQRVRLWVDDASALAWMAPNAMLDDASGIRVLPWPQATQTDQLADQPPADVWIEAFGCHIPEAFVAHGVASRAQQPVWINLEYLSAEDWVARMHGLPSPIMSGPAKGWTKHFFYPGFTPETGGLLREAKLLARQQA